MQVSPLFKKNFAQLLKFRYSVCTNQKMEGLGTRLAHVMCFFHSSEKRHAFEILPVPFSVTPWTAPKPEHKPMSFRIDEGMPL